VGEKPLNEQVAVVTGVSSGLGRALARLAAEERGARSWSRSETLDNCVGGIERSGSEGPEGLKAIASMGSKWLCWN
jgi:NAD(P)-dependent dehydrogenase (short-subunit alcohol dehydrogenase family)